MPILEFLIKILHKKIQDIVSKNEGVTLIFPIQNEIKIRLNRRHSFIFGRNDLRFFCVESWNHNAKIIIKQL